MMTWYYGNETGQIPGAFPDKWWEGSALFLALLQYWHFTGDTTYNSELSIGLQWQSGDDGDYMPSNYSSYLVRVCLPLKRSFCLIRPSRVTTTKCFGAWRP
jgi:mannan endo-1,6-alpha-mannosidase